MNGLLLHRSGLLIFITILKWKSTEYALDYDLMSKWRSVTQYSFIWPPLPLETPLGLECNPGRGLGLRQQSSPLIWCLVLWLRTTPAGSFCTFLSQLGRLRTPSSPPSSPFDEHCSTCFCWRPRRGATCARTPQVPPTGSTSSPRAVIQTARHAPFQRFGSILFYCKLVLSRNDETA